MRKSNYWLGAFTLSLIVLVAGLLRIWRIDSSPPALSWDEVSIGYNAYSILKTGRDEHGRVLPLDTFVGYGDYKPPLSVYATVPAVAIFGLNEFSIRLPSAIAGTVTVLLVYFLVTELIGIGVLSVLASVLLAISPWHIQLSRAGFEANIAVLFVTLGVTLVLKTRKNPKVWAVALIPFAAAIYTFNSARYFVPLLGAGLLVFLGVVSKKNMRWFGLGVVIAAVTLVPIVPHLLSKEARLRFKEVNIFTDGSVVLTANERMDDDGWSIFGRIVHNRRFGYAKSYLLHFFDHFDPQFLFIRGDGNPKFSIQDVGQLYLMEFPFLIMGVYWIFARYRRAGFLLVYWILASIIPAAVARETPHALRIENSLPVWQIFVAGGLVSFLGKFKSVTSMTLASLVILLAYFGSLSFYMHNYYVHYPKEFSGEWQYGYREAIRYVSDISSRYEKIYVTESIGRPYMYVLFYQRYDPSKYLSQKESYFDDAGFYHVSGFDRYEFVGNELPPVKTGFLYVLPAGSVPDGARILKTIRKLNGEPVLEIFDI